MAVTSTLFAIPSLVTSGRFDGADRWIRTGAALTSVAVGMQLAWTIAREAGFFA